MQNVLNLLDVAKASLCELRDDYMTWLLDHGLPPWRVTSEEAQAVYKVLLDKANYGDDVNYDLACHIIAMRERFRPWFRADSPRSPSIAVDSTATDSSRLPSIATDHLAAGVRFANAMLILIGRALHMLDRLLKQHGEDFVKEGGFSERMTAARVEEKRSQRRAVDEDAPPCPVCGGVMRVRHGKTGEFWGCTNYPACKGTRNIGQRMAKEGL